MNTKTLFLAVGIAALGALTSPVFAGEQEWKTFKAINTPEAGTGCATIRKELLIKHSNAIYDASFSSDGKLLATTGLDQDVKITDVQSGKLIRTLVPSSWMWQADFSPDGKYLVMTGSFGDFLIAEVSSGRKIRSLQNAPGAKAVFSPDGKYVAVTTTNAGVGKILDTATGQMLADFNHKEGVLEASFSPDGKYLITASYDNSSKLIEVPSGKEITRVSHQGTVWRARFSPDSNYVITASEDGTSKILNVKARQVVQEIKLAEPVRTASFSPDAKYVVSAGIRGASKLVETATGREITSLMHGGWVRAAVFSPDSKTLATGSEDGVLRIIDTATGRIVGFVDHGTAVDGAAFSPDSKYIITVPYDHLYNKIVRSMDGSEVRDVVLPGVARDAFFSPDGKYTLSSMRDSKIKLETVPKRLCVDDFEKPIPSPLSDEEIGVYKVLISDPKVPLSDLTTRLSSDVPSELRELREKLRIIRQSPHQVTDKFLDLPSAPASYYRQILKLAMKNRGRAGGKINPTSEQARRVLAAMINDGSASADDYEALSWLISRSGIPLDEKILEVFIFDQKKISEELDQMLKKDPMKYRGTSDLAAIKMIKAMLEHPDEDFVCGESDRQNRISNMLTWFASYGDNSESDRVFFAKLARLILEKRPVCSQNRNLLLTAMKDWSRTAAPVQYELTCAMAAQPRLVQERSFEEALRFATILGIKSELSPAAFLEQMQALGRLRANGYDDQRTIEQGLLKHVLGSPAGTIYVSKVGVRVAATEPHKGSVVKLCQIMIERLQTAGAKTGPVQWTEENAQLISGISLWIQQTREKLDQPRDFPDGFKPIQPGALKTLRAEFESQGMQSDLTALESGCHDIPALRKQGRHL